MYKKLNKIKNLKQLWEIGQHKVQSIFYMNIDCNLKFKEKEILIDYHIKK